MGKGVSGVEYTKIIREDSGNAFYFKPDMVCQLKSEFDPQTCPEGILIIYCDYCINVRLNTYTYHQTYRDLESVFDIALRIKK